MRRAVANGATALFLESRVIGSETLKPRGSRSLRRLLDRESSLGVILMLPGAFLLILFMAYPFFLGIWLSLTDSTIGNMGDFIGLRNFIDLLTDTIFHQTAWNTMIYAL